MLWSCDECGIIAMWYFEFTLWGDNSLYIYKGDGFLKEGHFIWLDGMKMKTERDMFLSNIYFWFIYECDLLKILYFYIFKWI